MELRNVVFKDKDDAIEALKTLAEIYFTYGYVPLSDLCGITDIPYGYSCNFVGWGKEIEQSRIIKAQDGWKLELPKTRPISEITNQQHSSKPIKLILHVDKVKDIDRSIKFISELASKCPDREIYLSIRN